MNHARLGVGLQGVALAAQAYNYAAEYARERVQGTDIEQMKDPHAPRIAINEHPDVRRMLLWCKAMVEGCRAMLYRTALYYDVAHASADQKEAGISRDLVDLLTPVCKAYISDMGFEVTRQAMQVLGGYGYVAEYPVEQHMRDIKIASIYEGTNGIQALDLLGRKLPKQQGRLFRNLVKAIERFTGGQKEHLVLGKAVGFFTEEVERLKKLTMDLAMIGMSGDRRYPVLHATPYLEMIGNVTCAWLLLEQAVVAHDKLQALYLDRGADDPEARTALHRDDSEARFYFNKIETARFFVFNILPRNQSIAAQFDSKDRSALEFIP
jgi:hypothetical protein